VPALDPAILEVIRMPCLRTQRRLKDARRPYESQDDTAPDSTVKRRIDGSQASQHRALLPARHFGLIASTCITPQSRQPARPVLVSDARMLSPESWARTVDASSSAVDGQLHRYCERWDGSRVR